MPNKNSKIYILDISSYIWVSTFEPSPSPSSQKPPQKPSQLKMAVALVCSFVCIGLAVAIYFLYCKYWKKQNQPNDTETQNPEIPANQHLNLAVDNLQMQSYKFLPDN